MTMFSPRFPLSYCSAVIGVKLSLYKYFNEKVAKTRSKIERCQLKTKRAKSMKIPRDRLQKQPKMLIKKHIRNNFNLFTQMKTIKI